MLRKLFAHGAIVISGMYIVFYFIDRVNPVMAFINNNITKCLMLILGLLSIFNSIMLIAEDRKKQRRRLQMREQMRQGRR